MDRQSFSQLTPALRSQLLQAILFAARCEGPIRFWAGKTGTAAAPSSQGLFPSGCRCGKLALEEGLFVLTNRRKPARAKLSSAGRSFLESEEMAALIEESMNDALNNFWQLLESSEQNSTTELCRKIEQLTGTNLQPVPSETEAEPDISPSTLSMTQEDEQFKYGLCRQIAYRWEQAKSEETRLALGDALINMDVQSIGEAGEVVPFDGKKHLAKPAAFRGDQVRIERPGWYFPSDKGGAVLCKALATPV